MKSQNIIFPSQGKVHVELQDVPPPQDREILCKANVSLVSIGTETHCLRGIYDPGTYWEEYIQYPFAPGYSMAAVVVQLGPGVTKFKVGDRVTTWAPHAQYFIANQDHLVIVPEGIEDEEAIWATLARTTQLGVRRAELAMGESACVVGLGILGQLVTQYLALCGVRHLIVIDTSQSRLDLAIKYGATHAICLPAEDAIAEVEKTTDGKMVDVVFDITGFPSVLASASKFLRKLGRLVLLGDSPTPSKQSLGPRIVGNSISILGIHGFMFPETETPFNMWTAENMTSLFFDYVQRKRMNVKGLLTHRCSPLDADEVYNSLAKKGDAVLGIALDWEKLKNTEA
ncbi:putative chlorophyll synthesis pathway protein BchC [Talaromyces proteolyticus]|uniref:Chlorophyll synthesis pathway protein BchC n=1 Tax=Talaromyces proteolyticus TaxID=1131652 RepID=A0AAD4PUS4_9EURO|nr:putative chlorophyll synthesis pathway protein BchC [Talaromyces proteolyticus]KAH8689685.1 putative chlorophyll synthesis pathway protein BchC [Talaromyces proteolyticus]